MSGFDPWAQYNQGLASLGGAVDDISRNQMNRQTMQRQNSLADLQLQKGNIELDALRRQAADDAGLRAAMMNAKPTTSTTTSYAQPTGAMPAAPTGLADLGNTILPAQRFGQPQPPLTPETAGERSPADGFALPGQPMAGIPQTSTTTASPNYDKIMLDTLRKQGRMDEAQKHANDIMTQAGKVASITGSMADATKYFNEATGANLQYVGSKGDIEIIKGDNGTVLAVNKTELAGGKTLQQATTTMQTGGSEQAFMQALAQLPANATASDIYGLAAKMGVKMEAADKAIDNKRQTETVSQTDFGTFKSGYKQEHPGANDAEISRAWEKRQLERAKANRQVVTSNPMPAKMNVSMNGVSQEDGALLAKAVEEGRANGDHINSRTAPVYAQMLRANPNLDLTSSAANAGALKKVESQRSMVSTFEKTASKNFDLVERLYDKNPQGTVMLLNKLKTNINTNITGDPDTVMLGRALKTSLMEYAKVVTGQTGGAAVSDSARKEVETLLSQSDKPEAFHGSIANHRLEMKNRMSGFQETVDELKGGRGGNSRAKPPTAKDPLGIL